DLAEVAVTGVELAPGLGDPDDRARQVLGGEARSAGVGAADEQAERRVAVVGETAPDAVGHAEPPGVAVAESYAVRYLIPRPTQEEGCPSRPRSPAARPTPRASTPTSGASSSASRTGSCGWRRTRSTTPTPSGRIPRRSGSAVTSPAPPRSSRSRRPSTSS